MGEWMVGAEVPLTWLQSAVLGAAAVASALVARRLSGAAAGGPAVWWWLAGAFVVLSLDEALALHDLLEEHLPSLRAMGLPVPAWLVPGDFLLLAMVLAGLVALPTVWAGLRSNGRARGALSVGVALAGLAVLLDAVKLPFGWMHGALGNSIEEVLELGSDLALLATVLLMLTALVRRPPGWSRPATAP